MKGKTQSDILCNEIQKQSKTEADAILEQAEKDVRRILDEAEKNADRIKADLMKQARTKAEGIQKRILSGVHLEIKKKRLRARESVLTKIFDSVHHDLITFRKDKRYKEVLNHLVLEGLFALDGGHIEIILGKVERDLLDENVLRALEKKACDESGKAVQLTLSKQSHADGGVVLLSLDGRTRFDNTFAARIRRMQDDMRLIIIKEISSS